MAKRVMVTQCSAGAQHQCVGCTLVDSFICTFLELFQAVLKWFPTEYQASILNKLASTMNHQSYHQEYELRLRLICLPTEKGTLRVEKRSLHAKCLLCGRLSAPLPSSSFTTDVRHRRQRLNGFGNETDPTLLASVNMLEISCTLAKL